MCSSILRHPKAVRSKNVAAKRCNVVHKSCYVRINDFRGHNLRKSRDILTDPIQSLSVPRSRKSQGKGPIVKADFDVAGDTALVSQFRRPSPEHGVEIACRKESQRCAFGYGPLLV